MVFGIHFSYSQVYSTIMVTRFGRRPLSYKYFSIAAILFYPHVQQYSTPLIRSLIPPWPLLLLCSQNHLRLRPTPL